MLFIVISNDCFTELLSTNVTCSNTSSVRAEAAVGAQHHSRRGQPGYIATQQAVLRQQAASTASFADPQLDHISHGGHVQREMPR